MQGFELVEETYFPDGININGNKSGYKSKFTFNAVTILLTNDFADDHGRIVDINLISRENNTTAIIISRRNDVMFASLFPLGFTTDLAFDFTQIGNQDAFSPFF